MRREAGVSTPAYSQQNRRGLQPRRDAIHHPHPNPRVFPPELPSQTGPRPPDTELDRRLNLRAADQPTGTRKEGLGDPFIKRQGLFVRAELVNPTLYGRYGAL